MDGTPTGTQRALSRRSETIDPGPQTRISYVRVKFNATDKSSGKKVRADLNPMWGGSGLHYSAYSTLAGDGT